MTDATTTETSVTSNGKRETSDDGFELDGTFYRWSVSDTGKDLMLIDRFSALPPHEFFAVIEDEFDRSRIPILLSLLATSIRAEHPDWSLERIVRTVMDLSLGEVVFIDGDTEEVEDESPPASAPPDGATTGSSPDASSPSPTPAATSPSETS